MEGVGGLVEGVCLWALFYARGLLFGLRSGGDAVGSKE